MTVSSPSRLRPILTGIAALAVVVTVLLWVTGTSDIERFEVGSGVALRGPSGAGAVLVRHDDGSWHVVDPRVADASTPIETPLLGEPVLSLGGTVFALHPDGMSMTRAVEGQVHRVDGLPLPTSARMLGVLVFPSTSGSFRDIPLVGFQAGSGDALSLAWIDLLAARGGDASEVIRTVMTADGQTPQLGPDAKVLTSVYGPAFAWIGADGWEAWSLVGEEGATRTGSLSAAGGNAQIGFELPGTWNPVAHVVVAEGHTCPIAHFAPDGKSLVLQGRRDGGLYALDLIEGRLLFMAEGNLGASRRVSPGGGFRSDPVRLVAGQWSREDYLQILETHLRGGGRMAFKISFMHNYLVALNPSGERMTYAGASFVEADDASFDEKLYAFDFGDPSRGALELGRRPGGIPDRGPLFVDNDVVVWIEDGVVHGLRYLSSTDTP